MNMTTANALLLAIVQRLPAGTSSGSYRYDCGECVYVTIPGQRRVQADGDSIDAAIAHLEARLDQLGLFEADAWGE